MAKQRQPAFRQTQVFDWSSEPHEERPSEFKQSTGYAVLSAFDALPDSSFNRRPPPRRTGGGLLKLVLSIGVAIGLGLSALWGYLHLLRS
jgi:hypothetical protein